MLAIDFEKHNEQSKKVWESFTAGQPIRVPVTVYADVRNYLAAEPEPRLTLADYLRDDDLAYDLQLKAREWIRHHILSDDGMGYPSAEEGWHIMVEYQNYFEPTWFGAPVIYTQEPHTLAYIGDHEKTRFLSTPLPRFETGLCGEAVRRYEYFREKAKQAPFRGIPVKNIDMPYNLTGTDGPFTLACQLRGTVNFILDMYEDPVFAKELFDYITTAVIERIKAYRRYCGMEIKADGFGIADDSIVLLSVDTYEEWVLPYHRRLYDELSKPDAGRGIHLCGDAQRFFPVLEKALHIKSFDTGFPVDFRTLYDPLNPDVQVLGGVECKLLLEGTPEQVTARVQDILTSGVMEKSKKFILREANALSPGTPCENVEAMYRACEKYGCYPK